jgi:transposase
MLTREEFDRLRQEDPESLWKIMADFAARVAALEEKIAPKPHTPSSAQGVLKPMSQRAKTGKKPGGQRGHKGHTLLKNTAPDEVKNHQPKACPQCGLDLAGIEGEFIEARQVVDLPEVIRLLTVEHRAFAVCCPGCNCQVKADFPEHVTAPVAYGPHLQTTCTLLKMEQAISLERIVQMLADWFGHSPSEGTIQNWIGIASVRLAPIEAKIKEGIIQAASAGFDETCVRSGKKNAWIHVARTQKLTHFSSPGGRGKVAIEKAGILPAFRGVAHHDAWRAYLSFSQCSHSLCCAHLLREGAALKDRFDKVGAWSEPILAWLRKTKKQKDSGHLGDSEMLFKQLRALVAKAYKTLGCEPPIEGKTLSSCPKELTSRIRWLDRLWSYAREVTRFAWDVLAEFDNNGSERDIRPVKLFSKVFGCWRSTSGLEDFCRLRGYLSTLRKQGISTRKGMLSVFLGEPVCPATA